MVHVPDHLSTVRDLAEHISKLLELASHRIGPGTEPPQLLLDGFQVLDDEEIHSVLRDDEVVDIEPTEGMLSLAAQPAWSSPGATGSASKRPLDWSIDSKADAKRPKGGKGGKGSSPAPMALGWQSAAAPGKASSATAPVTLPATLPGRAKPQVAEDSEEEESSDNETTAKQSKPPVRDQKGIRVQAEAAEAAKATALATCDKSVAASASASTSRGEEAGIAIFVGGLPQTVDDDELKKYFEKYGQVTSATIVLNNSTGKSKGYGFVEFLDDATRAKVLADGPKMLIAGKMAEVKPKVAKGSGSGGKGKDGKSKDHKGKDSRGETKGKGGKGEAAGKQSKGKGKHTSLEDSDDTEEDSSEDEAPKKVPAPSAKASAPEQESLISNEELEVQKQMAALGLPVSFTAGEMAGGDSDEEEDEDEEEEDA